ncbi:hypothetical protein [Kibdelosporangium aridum]|uniref:hypothetical protein n=1 Tax=Kibdelosporangium aridum TaxID=2030 RepID=UPI0035F07E41
MSGTSYVHKMNQTELCALLEVDERGLRKLTRRGLPAPMDSDDEGTWWSITAVRDWLTTTGSRPARSLMLTWWPDASAPADLVDMQLVRRQREAAEPVAVVQHWQTSSGTVVLAWPVGDWPVTGPELAGWAPDAEAYLAVGTGWDVFGPCAAGWWPFTGTVTIPRHTTAGAEFLARLTPAPERTAVYVAIDREREARPMVDPETDMPVAVPDDNGLDIQALTPQRLPATSPLAELILEPPIWVRTHDGTLYPAPSGSGSGLSWGYSGTGPATLAELVDALLEDINAQHTTSSGPAPRGLLELFQQDLPTGTILTRAQLAAARDT